MKLDAYTTHYVQLHLHTFAHSCIHEAPLEPQRRLRISTSPYTPMHFADNFAQRRPHRARLRASYDLDNAARIGIVNAFAYAVDSSLNSASLTTSGTGSMKPL